MDFDGLVEAQTGLGTAAIIVMNKQCDIIRFVLSAKSMFKESRRLFSCLILALHSVRHAYHMENILKHMY